jgi:hypothetical protein
VTVGSWVTFDIPTAWDSIDGLTNVFHVSGPLPDFVAEINTSTIFASRDKSGNQGSCSINVTVVASDQQIGLICPPSQTLTTLSNDGVVAYYALPAVSPSSAGWEIGLVQGPLSGSVFPLGTTLVVYRAVRQSVIQTCNFTIMVTVAGKASSCSGQCGKKLGNCWCDTACNKTNDCCPDQAQFCGPAPLTLASCAGANLCELMHSCSLFILIVGACGLVSDGCYCDSDCAQNGDCCSDYQLQCASPQKPQGSCAKTCVGRGKNGTSSCYCDASCLALGDCCQDRTLYCPVCFCSLKAMRTALC